MNQAPPQEPQNPLANYQFSQDELRVLRECNRQAFYQRSLPASGILGALTYYAVHTGYFKGSGRYGAAPKVCAAVAVGYFLGKVSFQSQCAQMLMQIPNSKLAEVLKQKRQGSIYSQLSPDQGFGTGLSLQPFSSYSDTYSDEEKRPAGSLEMDESRPNSVGLDDVYRPTLDSTPMQQYDVNLPLEPARTGVSYDELRKKNREEYYQKQQPPFSATREQLPPVTRAPQPPTHTSPLEEPINTGDEPSYGRKNKYGDAWSR